MHSASHNTGLLNNRAGTIMRVFRISIMGVLASLFLTNTSIATNNTEADGGSIQTKLGHGIVVNKGSSLRREWVAVHDNTMSVDFHGTPGVKTIFKKGGRYSSGEYLYRAWYSIRVTEPVVAIEVRFVLFDVWGDRTKVLTATDITDLVPGRHTMRSDWNIRSENEVSEHYASIAYVALVRTKAGEIQRADTDAVADLARKYMSNFTTDLLDEDLAGKGK